MLSFLGVATAHAQYSTTTASTDVTNAINSAGSMFQTNIPIILGIMVALIGLGWGVRKFQRHVSGRKF